MNSYETQHNGIQRDEEYLENLKREIHEFEQEKERIRRVMGELGGRKYSSRDLTINIIFAVATVGILLGQVIFHFDSILSIEIAIFLVSLKIILMIHAQHKHNHFMFWVLNTIEYRLNDTHKLVDSVHTNVAAMKAKVKEQD